MTRALTVALVLLAVAAIPNNAAAQGSGASPAQILGAALHGEIDVARARRAPRPRSFAHTGEWAEIRSALLEGRRAGEFRDFLAGLASQLGEPASFVLDVPQKGVDFAAHARWEVAIKQQVESACRGAQNLAFAALVTGRADYARAARRKLLLLTELDPRGPTSIAEGDLSARMVAWTLALGLDWLYSQWSAAEKEKLLAAIRPRVDDFSERWIHGPRSLVKQPADSHGNEIIGAFAEIGVLLAGETPEADRWMRDIVPVYARHLSPFGGDDGGYANGTSYAFVDMTEFSLRHWDTLRRVLGLDLTLKPWARNFGRFLVYFLPPGTPVGAFGDAAEQNSALEWALTAQAYAARVPLPLHRWYARQWFQGSRPSMDGLLAPYVEFDVSDLPEGVPNAAHFPSIGWVAMHSDLRDRGRTSVYFKSSPYGANSHGHYDQNSFVLNAGGRPLLIDSGYYDSYGSKHHFGWTFRTKAHNAVTADGGRGQESERRMGWDAAARGRIIRFSTDGRVDVAVGDATESYTGLQKAVRGLVYERNEERIIVFDRLAAEAARVWEWNLHALNRFHVLEDGHIEVRNTDMRVCIDFRSSAKTAFGQHDRFDFEPIRDARNPRPSQWHGTWVTEAAAAHFDAVAILTVGCRPQPQPHVTFDAGGSVVDFGGVRYRFSGGSITRTEVP
ncbi:heparinase II/III family protein [Accumulibacter sp.]|uniref:heparinase II/III domain-containing protein n=1 Tax=Accumulibacter sp. TaxID=2053492 RepID=UPI0025FC0414|nr:heparinase II/III family protein [Accumulibacter sp.]MCM8635393.1 heparinase II/III family protein [Accumulibacter sp.]MCM8638998.1 heparinase II/III family protein [Accumulibacter sp.]